MPTDTVKYKITADSSKYERASARVRKATVRMADAVTKNVGLMAVAFGVTLVYGMKKAVEAAIEQEAVERRLAAVVSATGGAAGFSAQQMFDMAGAMQQVTTVGDETIIKGMAVLATFKQIRGEGFERATMAALDMAEVMQTDLKSSMVMIGKAMNDPIANLSAMTRAGVQFTGAQKDMIKELWNAGDAAGAQNIILKELEGQMGGTAAAAKDTFGGAIKSLSNTFGDLLETVGFTITKNKEFIGIIKDLESSFSNMIQVFEGGKSFWEFFWGESKFEENKRKAKEALDLATSYHGEFSGVSSDGGAAGGGVSPDGGQGEAIRQTLEDQHALYLNYFSQIDESELASIENRRAYEQTARDQRIQAIIDEHMAQLGIIEERKQAELAAEQAITAGKAQAAEREKQLNQMKLQSAKFTTDNMIKTGKMLLGGAMKGNKALFEATKALSIGQAIMSTYTGAANAMRDVPYPYNFIAAGSVIAFGIAQVSQIMSQSMNSTSPPSGGGVGVPAISATTAPVVDALPATTGENAKPTLTINIEGDFIGDEQYIDTLVEKINAAEDRSVYINQTNYAGALA